MIERGVILAANDSQIDVPDLFPHVKVDQPALRVENREAAEESAHQSLQTNANLDRVFDHLLSQKISIATIENGLLDKAVERAGGNLSYAGRMLGLTRPQIAYRLKKYANR